MWKTSVFATMSLDDGRTAYFALFFIRQFLVSGQKVLLPDQAFRIGICFRHKLLNAIVPRITDIEVAARVHVEAVQIVELAGAVTLHTPIGE